MIPPDDPYITLYQQQYERYSRYEPLYNDSVDHFRSQEEVVYYNFFV